MITLHCSVLRGNKDNEELTIFKKNGIMKTQIDAMDKLVQLGGNTKPQKGYWGIYLYCDVNHPCVSGGGFHWFENESDLLELSRFLCWFFPVGEEEYDPELFSQNSKIIDQLKENDITWNAAQEKVNELLSGSLQIDWWGQVDELISGAGDFPEMIRNYFWLSLPEVEDEENVEPIPNEKVGSFLDWLSEYV